MKKINIEDLLPQKEVSSGQHMTAPTAFMKENNSSDGKKNKRKKQIKKATGLFSMHTSIGDHRTEDDSTNDDSSYEVGTFRGSGSNLLVSEDDSDYFYGQRDNLSPDSYPQYFKDESGENMNKDLKRLEAHLAKAKKHKLANQVKSLSKQAGTIRDITRTIGGGVGAVPGLLGTGVTLGLGAPVGIPATIAGGAAGAMTGDYLGYLIEQAFGLTQPCDDVEWYYRGEYYYLSGGKLYRKKSLLGVDYAARDELVFDPANNQHKSNPQKLQEALDILLGATGADRSVAQQQDIAQAQERARQLAEEANRRLEEQQRQEAARRAAELRQLKGTPKPSGAKPPSRGDLGPKPPPAAGAPPPAAGAPVTPPPAPAAPPPAPAAGAPAAPPPAPAAPPAPAVTNPAKDGAFVSEAMMYGIENEIFRRFGESVDLKSGLIKSGSWWDEFKEEAGKKVDSAWETVKDIAYKPIEWVVGPPPPTGTGPSAAVAPPVPRASSGKPIQVVGPCAQSINDLADTLYYAITWHKTSPREYPDYSGGETPPAPPPQETPPTPVPQETPPTPLPEEGGGRGGSGGGRRRPAPQPLGDNLIINNRSASPTPPGGRLPSKGNYWVGLADMDPDGSKGLSMGIGSGYKFEYARSQDPSGPPASWETAPANSFTPDELRQIARITPRTPISGRSNVDPTRRQVRRMVKQDIRNVPRRGPFRRRGR